MIVTRTPDGCYHLKRYQDWAGRYVDSISPSLTVSEAQSVIRQMLTLMQGHDEAPPSDDNRAPDDDDPRYDGTMRRGMRGFTGGKP